MLSQTFSGALTTSTHAIAVGVIFAVGDAAVQFVISEAKVKFQTFHRKLCEREEDGDDSMVWDLARTYSAFVLGATVGTGLSWVTMTFVKHLSAWEIIVNIVPTELMLLPFQLQWATGNSRHFVRNLPGYMLLLTLLNLVVGYPTLIWSLLEPSTGSGLPLLVALQVRSLLLGLSAMGLFMFANRYPSKQWRMEVASDSGDWVRQAHPVLICAGQAAGNASWVMLSLFAVFSDSNQFPLFLTMPLMCYQVIVNTHMQLVASGQVPVGTRMLRVFLPILTIPADHIKQFSSLEQSFNMLAFSSYTLWVGSFQDEWKELYDIIEGGVDCDDFILNRFIEPEQGSPFEHGSKAGVKEAIAPPQSGDFEGREETAPPQAPPDSPALF